MPGLISSANSAPKCLVTSRHCEIKFISCEEDDVWYFIEAISQIVKLWLHLQCEHIYMN